jgi:hypothetical protein
MSIHMQTLEVLKGGLDFNPTDEDLSVGTPEREKPLDLIAF